MADLSNIGALDDTGTVYLYHPVTDEPLTDDAGEKMYVEVYGADSEKYKQITHEQQNRRIKQAQRSGGKLNMTAEQLDKSGLELLSKCTIRWNIVLDGEVPECTLENVQSVYTNYPWVRDQVESFIHDRKNFLVGSSGN